MIMRKLKFGFACVAILGGMVSAKRPATGPGEEGQRARSWARRRNRIAAVAGVRDGAHTTRNRFWRNLNQRTRQSGADFDKQPGQHRCRRAPSDTSTVWAGTGEAWMIRDTDVMGNGIYKSTDAGKTWTNMGLQETGRIGRVIIHPSDPNIVFVCALGRATGPQAERGVFRTLDGGQHWERVLFAGENVGCSGLSMDPHNARTLFAGMWQVEMHTWGEFSGGPGSGIYVSRDGGSPSGRRLHNGR